MILSDHKILKCTLLLAQKVSRSQRNSLCARATNALFDRIGRIATEDVVLHLLQTKCISILLWS